MTSYRFARRLGAVPPSFLGTLFAVSADPSVISFAGGLPSPAVLDADGIARAAADVFAEVGPAALQYASTDGYRPLREFIADRYRRRVGLDVTAGQIQIVNGSQQCLDLVAKCLVDPGDTVVVEAPGYLGAIEAFSLYEPRLLSVPIDDRGPDLETLGRLVSGNRPKFFYAIPNAQNPSGLTYPDEARGAVADILDNSGTLLYEDDAFGELFFDGRPREPIMRRLPGQSVLSGSFSKVLAPGMRCGWIVAPEPVLAQFNIAKQAADLHSNHLCQLVLMRWLETNDLDAQCRRVARYYEQNCHALLDALDDRCPELDHTTPEGGMFLLARLPPGISSLTLFEEGVHQGVAVMPGRPFYLEGGDDVVRLNFSCVDPGTIDEGVARIGRVLRALGS
ncbi:MAG: PLP-dependent aminotransferase family protein [Methanoregulaceae archaeon]